MTLSESSLKKSKKLSAYKALKIILIILFVTNQSGINFSVTGQPSRASSHSFHELYIY